MNLNRNNNYRSGDKVARYMVLKHPDSPSIFSFPLHRIPQLIVRLDTNGTTRFYSCEIIEEEPVRIQFYLDHPETDELLGITLKFNWNLDEMADQVKRYCRLPDDTIVKIMGFEYFKIECNTDLN